MLAWFRLSLPLLAGIVSALTCLLAPLAGAPWSGALVTLVSVPIFMTGLSFGFLWAVVACIAAIITFFIGYGIADGLTMTLQVTVVFFIPALVCIQRVLLVRRGEKEGLEWYPPGLALTWLTGIGLVYLMCFFGWTVFTTPEGGIQDTLIDTVTTYFMGINTALAENGQAPWPADQISEISRKVALFLPSLVVTLLLFHTLTMGLVSQAFLVWLKWNRRPSMQMIDITLPSWVSVAMGLNGLVGLFGQGDAAFVGMNVAFVLTIPLMFAGFAVVHAFASTLKTQVGMLIGFYAFLILMGPLAWMIVMPIVIMLGLVDEWAGLRRRCVAKAQIRR